MLAPPETVCRTTYRTPRDHGDRNPDQVRVAVKRPALEHVGRLAAEPLQNAPKRHRYEASVAIDKTRSTCVTESASRECVPTLPLCVKSFAAAALMPSAGPSRVRTTQQPKVVGEMPLALASQIAAYGAGQEQDDHYRRRDPKGPVQVWVAVQNVEEVCTRKDCCGASAQHLGGVDVEELRVEGDAPEVALRAEKI